MGVDSLETPHRKKKTQHFRRDLHWKQSKPRWIDYTALFFSSKLHIPRSAHTNAAWTISSRWRVSPGNRAHFFRSGWRLAGSPRNMDPEIWQGAPSEPESVERTDTQHPEMSHPQAVTWASLVTEICTQTHTCAKARKPISHPTTKHICSTDYTHHNSHNLFWFVKWEVQWSQPWVIKSVTLAISLYYYARIQNASPVAEGHRLPRTICYHPEITQGSVVATRQP